MSGKFLFEPSMELSHVRPQLGGKAAQLLWLQQSGFAVPAWCALSAEVIRARQFEGQTLLSAEDRAEIREWMEKQNSARFIVRSSANVEDSAKKSFAGIFESYPNLTTVEDVIKAIEDCVAAASNARVNSYIGVSALEVNPLIEMAVILQVMVDAEKSGVLFTADPRDGSRRRFLISATYGAAHGAVSGECACDEYSVVPATLQIDEMIAKKDDRYILPVDRGLVKEATPQELRELPVLSRAEIMKLVGIGKRAAALAKKPQDIEWVIAGTQVIIVQTRAITSLGVDRSEQSEFVFDNSNIQESFCGLTLPLTFSYASLVYQSVYSHVMRLMGADESDVRKHDRRHSKMLALIHGRVYYNINSWYEGLLLMPSFGKNKKDMEAMMGLEKPVDFIVDQVLSPKEKWRRTSAILRLISRLIVAFARLNKIVLKFRQDFAALEKKFWAQELHWQTPTQIFDNFIGMRDAVLGMWHAPIINDFYVMMKSGKARRILKKYGLEDRLPDLLCGEELESLKPTLQLIEMAEEIRKFPKLADALLDHTNFMLELRNYQSVRQKWQSYISEYGDRVPGELKLEVISYRENPAFLIQILRGYVEDKSITVRAIRNRNQQTRFRAESEVFTQIRARGGPLGVWRLKRALAALRRGIAFREAMRLDRTRSFGMARFAFRLLGEKLFEQDFLESAEDIFYLTVNELDEYLSAKAPFDNPKELIVLRKKQYKEWSKRAVPGQIRASVPLREVAFEAANVASGDLCGRGCYPGVVEAEVVVLTEPTAANLKNKILVAPRTDPGWTPLFTQICGLIVESGSLLSHSAVIAREMGIPTIVSVPGVVSALKAGERIKMDGQTGRICRVCNNTNESQGTEITC